MTCIVAIVENGTVYMGADSACITGMQQQAISEPKIWLHGEMLLGDAGTVRAGQILRYKFKPPPIRKPLLAYFASTFRDALHKAMTEGNCQDPTEILVGVRGQLFRIAPDGAVTDDTRVTYDAIGHAAPYAIGAMFMGTNLQPRARMFMGLSAAKKHVAGILPPFIYLETPSGENPAPTLQTFASNP